MTLTTEPDTRPADHVRATMCATRVAFTWFGTRKSLTPQQKARAAESFSAASEFLTAGKRLLDTRHPQFKAVTSIRNQTRAYWASISLPYPEAGIRLVRQDTLESFQDQLTDFKRQLDEAVDLLDDEYATLKLAAQERLGSLFSAADYPASLTGLFDVSWDFPSVEPPDYLRGLNPQLYEQECQRVQSRFQQAVELAEQAFTEEFSRLVSHLSERLSGQEDGRPKIFRDSAVGKLREFFERFRALNVRSNEQLDQLVSQCGQIVEGV